MADKLAIYAGSFDLLTIGHLWMINQGSKLFDKLLVSIGENPEKNCMFSINDRLEMLIQSTKEISNIEVDSFPYQFLVDYAASKNAQFILRGIRSTKDYEMEREMRNINCDLNPAILTVFLFPPRELCEVSSSMVKGLIGPKGWEKAVKRYLPGAVFNILRKEIYAQSK
jgi:pantetheine-phosphate adenylyltransferase